MRKINFQVEIRSTITKKTKTSPWEILRTRNTLSLYSDSAVRSPHALNYAYVWALGSGFWAVVEFESHGSGCFCPGPLWHFCAHIPRPSRAQNACVPGGWNTHTHTTYATYTTHAWYNNYQPSLDIATIRTHLNIYHEFFFLLFIFYFLLFTFRTCVYYFFINICLINTHIFVYI